MLIQFKHTKKKRAEEFKYVFVEEQDLSEEESKVWNRRYEILELVGEENFKYEIHLSETIRKVDEFDSAVGVWDNGSIIIKRSELNKFSSFAGTLLHELAHAISNASDISREFENKLTSYLGLVASKCLEPEDLSTKNEVITDQHIYMMIETQSDIELIEEDINLKSNNEVSSQPQTVPVTSQSKNAVRQKRLIDPYDEIILIDQCSKSSVVKRSRISPSQTASKPQPQSIVGKTSSKKVTTPTKPKKEHPKQTKLNFTFSNVKKG